MTHPFTSAYVTPADLHPHRPMAPVMTGADAASAPAVEAKKESHLGLLVAVLAGVGAAYYLGSRNGKIEGYVRGYEHAERDARDTLRTHVYAHAPIGYPPPHPPYAPSYG